MPEQNKLPLNTKFSECKQDTQGCNGVRSALAQLSIWLSRDKQGAKSCDEVQAELKRCSAWFSFFAALSLLFVCFGILLLVLGTCGGFIVLIRETNYINAPFGRLDVGGYFACGITLIISGIFLWVIFRSIAAVLLHMVAYENNQISTNSILDRIESKIANDTNGEQ
ncbi:MAG: hypothetical protein ACRC2T_17120 [Thermoguttaceae bacterium]